MSASQPHPDQYRRRMLGYLGASACCSLGSPLVSGQGSAAPDCIVVPRQTDGPYFLDERLERSDIRSDPDEGEPRPGLPLRLALTVAGLDGKRCSPLAGAVVDLWQCDAFGEYAGVRDPLYDNRGLRYLRGYQRVNREGLVEFLTLFPGWYPSRAVHIHIKVRTEPERADGLEFASQLYFEDAFTDMIHTRYAPYDSRPSRSTRNSDDRIFSRGGAQLLLQPTMAGEILTATFELALKTA